MFKLIPLIAISALITAFFTIKGSNTINEHTGARFSGEPGETFAHLKKCDAGEEEGAGSYEIMKKYFDRWYTPYGMNLPQDFQKQLKDQVDAMDHEPLTDLAVNQWTSIGPYGQSLRGDSYWQSGRVRDLEPPGSVTPSSLRVAAASGGVWRYIVVGLIAIPVSFGDRLPTPWVGSLCTHPTLDSTVFVGTGEPYVAGGYGMYKTTNLGLSWSLVSMTPNPSGFYKIRYQQGSSLIMHCGAVEGYYRSADGGTSWTRYFSSGPVTDFTINPSNVNEIYIGVRENGSGSGGIWKSTTNGTTWNKVTTTPLPVSNVRDVTIAHAPSNPQIIYANISRNDNGQTLGFFKTTNGGSTWLNITPAGPPLNDIHWGQGGYDDAVVVSPLNPNIVFCGGGNLIRTTDGGASWANAGTIYHPDQHILRYRSDGSTLYNGNDGGMFFSSNNGASWQSVASNSLPITQFYSIATPMNEKNTVLGGTQDNGTPISLNSINWYVGTGGDGAGACVDPVNTNICYSFAWGVGGYAMHRYQSSDAMLNATSFNTGIPPNSYWWGCIVHDRVPSVLLYTNSGPYVYYSVTPYSSWTQMNSTAFPYEVWGLSSSKYVSGSTILYAALNNTAPNLSAKLRVYDGGTWYERSSGLPSGTNVRSVSQHPVSNLKAYAFMDGFTSPGQKLFKTINKGVSWVNITGNLPNAAFSGMVPHPTNDNIMVAGSNIGMFKTTNGGASWFTWMNGMPDVNIITDLTWIDSTAINGKFFVVAGTYGRSAWTREINGDDFTGIVKNNNSPVEFKLDQNYPNPFNPVTTISFELPRPARVKISVFDIQGKEIEVIVDKNETSGSYRVEWDAAKYSSGIYFYRITAGDFVQTKKMILVK
jgi:photosystem II stability/assembly factor-like uncharacterized protein